MSKTETEHGHFLSSEDSKLPVCGHLGTARTYEYPHKGRCGDFEGWILFDNVTCPECRESPEFKKLLSDYIEAAGGVAIHWQAPGGLGGELERCAHLLRQSVEAYYESIYQPPMSTDRVDREFEDKYQRECQVAEKDRFKHAAHLYWMLTGHRITATEKSRDKPSEFPYETEWDL